MAKISYAEAERLAISGKLDDAEVMCRTLLKHFPDNFPLLYLLSSICLLTRRYEESARICQKLLVSPQVNADVYNALAAICTDFEGDFEQARKWLEKALEVDPGHRKALINLGNYYLRKHADEQALTCYRQANSDDKPNPEAFFGFGLVCMLNNQFKDAMSYFQASLDLDPENVMTLASLIEATAKAGKVTQAMALVRRVLEFKNPGIASLVAFAFAKFYAAWDVSDKLESAAIQELRNPYKSFNLFLLVNLSALAAGSFSNKFLLELHCSLAGMLRRYMKSVPFDGYPKAFTPSKRMRIGYVSADLRNHVVSKFFRSLVHYCNHDQFEIFLYSNLPVDKEDEISAEYRKEADHFVSILDMDDVQASKRIHDDGIHILIDLGGYTTSGRYELMLYRSAPVQIAYLGYPFSYGMEEIDYVISDPWLDGPENANYFIEKPLKLPESFITIAQLPERNAAYNPPLARNGYVTFGTMNNTYKLSSSIISTWSKILQRIPQSRIYLNHPNFKYDWARENVISTFSRCGIAPERVVIVFEKHPTGSHILYYNEIDIALDTIPQTGGTTTVEALWMGVPVITLVGEVHSERLSYSIIKNAGIDLDDCIAWSEQEYIKLAVNLARNIERVKFLRREIPEAIRSGIMGQPARFTAQLESAYLEAWNTKFPEMPTDLLLSPKGLVPLPIGKNSQLVVRDLDDDKYAYILREQKAWFEVESTFIELNAACFSLFWDFSEDPGVFVIPYAKEGADKGTRAVAIRSNAGAIKLIECSIKQNQLSNVEIASSPSENASTPDLVRFSLEFNDMSDESITDWIERIGSSSPLVLVSLQNSRGVDTRATNILLQAGYQPYRLLPGYNLLAPLGEDDEISESDINLFFCKPDRAASLEAKGILCPFVDQSSAMPTVESTLWSHTFSGLPYASDRLAAWQAVPPFGKWGDTYLLALNLHSAASEGSLAPGERLAHIRMAQNILTLLIQEEPTVARVLTGIRIFTDSGRRKQAALWAGSLLDQLSQHNTVNSDVNLFNEPFLAPLKRAELFEIHNDLSWAKSMTALTFESLRSFSTWFTGEDSLKAWKRLSELEPIAGSAAKIVALIEQRFADKR